MNQTNKTKLNWLSIMLAAPIVTFAQEAQVSSSTYFSNALFNTLLGVIILLLIVILAMTGVLRNLSQSEHIQNKFKENKTKTSNGPKTIIFLALFSLIGNQLMAGGTSASASNNWTIGGLDYFTFYFLVGIIIVEFIFLLTLFNIVKGFIRNEFAPAKNVVDGVEVKVAKEQTIFDKLNASVEIEKEAEIMLDHDYDGIKELDNNLPPWWKYGFYLTIAIGVVYLINFHISGTGDLQGVEYTKEVAAAKLQIEEFMKTSANNVDETSVKLLTDAKEIEAGKAVFIEFNCKQCHGAAGEGNSVGPNLTDAYWLHGGSIVDIFKTVKYGWQDKGMKSWKEDLSPMQIAQVSSYIKSLAGTNPPNAKAAQGDLFVEAGVKPVNDSTAVMDSLSVKIKTDSLNLKN